MSLYEETPGIDLILMDFDMPVMTGLEATSLLREFENGDKVFIGGLTGFNTQSAKEEGLESGMNRVLVKPITQEQVSELLDDLMNNKLF